MSISGKMSGARINGVYLVGTHDYTFEETVDELDGTTAADLGFGRPDTGVKQGTIRLTLYFDLSTGVYTPVRAGTEITNLTLYDDVTGTAFATIPTARVFRSSKKGSTRDRLMVDCEAKTVGAYTVYGV